MKTTKLLAFVLALVLAIAPVTVFAAGEEKYDMDPTHLTFASQADYDAIVTGTNHTEATLENGELKVVTKDCGASPDPYVFISLENLKTSIQAEDYKYCAIVYKIPTTNVWNSNVVSEMYFNTKGAEPAEERHLPVFVTVGDRYAYSVFDLSLISAELTGTLTSLRFDYFYGSYWNGSAGVPIPDGETMYIHDIMFFADETSARSGAGSLAYELNQATSVPRNYDMDPTHIIFKTQADYDAVMYRDDGKDPGKRTSLSHEDEMAKFTVDLKGETADPYVYVSLGKLLTSIKAEDYPYCTIVYKMPASNSSAKNSLDVYFDTKGTFPNDNSQMLGQETTASDKYQYALYNPGTLTDWNGIVSSVRLDYLNTTMVDGDVLYVHDIMFFADSKSAVATTEAIVNDLNLPENLELKFDVGEHGTAPAAQTVKKGAIPTRPEDPTEEGFIFDGWYTSKTYSTEYNFDAPLTKESTTLYAKWAKANVITFDVGAGYDAPAAQYVKRNDRVSVPEVPFREGFVVAGWYTDEALTKKYDFTKIVTESFTLYAEWVKAYAVTVKNGTADAVQAPAGAKVTVTADAAPEGMKFDHWELISGGEFINEEDKDGKKEVLTFLQTEGGCSIVAVFVDESGNVVDPGDDKDGVKAGDVNGDNALNAKDVTSIMKFLVGKTPKDFNEKAADYNGDGKTNAKDVTGLMKFLVKGA